MNKLERAVRNFFDTQPWRLYTICIDCGELRHCAGKSRDKMRCLTCFGETL